MKSTLTTTSTLARTDFSLVEGAGIESGACRICPTIDPASLVGPGPGVYFIYEVGRIAEPCDPTYPAMTTGYYSTAERFKKLASEWKSAVRFLSDTDEMCSHPAYQEIIGMGSAVLPFIFAELERKPDNWFWALKAITGEDPVTEEHRGDVAMMAVDWLHWWAKNNGWAIMNSQSC